MTTDQIILFTLLAGVLGLLLWGRWRYDLVAFGALMVGVVLGVVPAESAFSGFGHPATLIVALVLIVSAALVRSGAVQLVTRTLIDSARGPGLHIGVMGMIGAALSAFMNNVAALALLMPVDVQTARKAGRLPGLTLMPLSFATILGGMVTLIGTPPNIVIASIREDRLGAPFAMFDFAPVGGITAMIGLAFVALIGWRLIPVEQDAQAGAAPGELAQFIAELAVPEGSKLIGRKVRELYADANKAEVAILGLARGGKRMFGPAREVKLKEGDALVLEATPEALDEFRAALDLDFSEARRKAMMQVEAEGMAVTEVVVPQGARIAGKSCDSLGLAWRHRTIVIGISRRGRRITERVRRAVVQPGDILLLLAPEDQTDAVVAWIGALPLADRGLVVTDQRKSWLVIGLFAAAVVAASVGLIELPIALGLVVVAYVLARVLPLSELYDHVDWPVIVLLGSMIPLGAALESSGGTEIVVGALMALTGDWPAWAVLAALMVVTMTLSDVLNNTATAIIAAPIAIGLAERLGVSPDPFLMAVAVAASCAFLTPIGHQNNTLILGPGGYGFGDYWRMGLPLEIIVVAVSVPAILVFWPL